MNYSLMHAPTLHAEAPYTFELPYPALIDALEPGDHAKLGFEYHPAGEQYGAERMWVLIDRVDGDRFSGTIDNEPAEDILSYGDSVVFSRANILDASFADGKKGPSVPSGPDYFRRCMVDACVLHDSVPVEYLYREDPDLAGPDDKYPDSGWRIRGRRRGETDEEMDDREPAYVALGSVLNRDDSWLHLIDAPIGSAYMRNFETGTYEKVR